MNPDPPGELGVTGVEVTWDHTHQAVCLHFDDELDHRESYWFSFDDATTIRDLLTRLLDQLEDEDEEHGPHPRS